MRWPSTCKLGRGHVITRLLSHELTSLHTVSNVLLPMHRRLKRASKAVRRNADGYKMFFLNTVAVAPNKFRPSSKMGDMRYVALRPS